jgi:hypothetical protein
MNKHDKLLGALAKIYLKIDDARAELEQLQFDAHFPADIQDIDLELIDELGDLAATAEQFADAIKRIDGIKEAIDAEVRS